MTPHAHMSRIDETRRTSQIRPRAGTPPRTRLVQHPLLRLLHAPTTPLAHHLLRRSPEPPVLDIPPTAERAYTLVAAARAGGALPLLRHTPYPLYLTCTTRRSSVLRRAALFYPYVA